MIGSDQPVWPVDLDQVRLWPMESEDGPLLQELFDDLSDFRAAFGEPGAADAVSTFIGLPKGYDYDSKLLVGIWRNRGLVGALDCIVGYPTSREWTVGLLAVADRHRRSGIGSSVLGWLERAAADRGATGLRGPVRRENTVGLAFARHCGYALEELPAMPDHLLAWKPL